MRSMRDQTMMKTTSRSATIPTRIPISATVPWAAPVTTRGSIASFTCKVLLISATAITRLMILGEITWPSAAR
jgi:hypothetical protein